MAEAIWEHCGYVGLFADAYVAGTELENGHIANSLLFLQLLLKKAIERGQLGIEARLLSRLSELLAKSVTAAQQVLRAQKPSELLILLKTWTALLEQLGLHEQLLVPGGWRGSSTNWVVFLVERTSEDFYSFSVCNRGPTAAQYHPSKFLEDGAYGQKLKILATLTLTDVPKTRLCDPGFWALAFGQWVPNATEYHRAEGRVQDLEDEVAELRQEVRRLRRLVSELRSAVEESDSRSDTRDQSYTSATADRQSASRSPAPSPVQPAGYLSPDRREGNLQSVPETPLPVQPTTGTQQLSWLEREAICDQIGRFLARSISGQFRGSSGRDRIPLPSRQDPWPEDTLPYITAEGVINLNYPVGLFSVEAESFSTTLQLIQIGEFEEKLLVAVPEKVWHRTLSKCILPANALSKPTLVEVAASEIGNLSEPLPDSFLRVWIGFLKRDYYESVEILEESNVEHCFDLNDDPILVPHAQALIDVAQEHFAFFSADGASPAQPNGSAEEDIDGEPLEPGDAGLEEDYTPGGVHRRVDRIETALLELTAAVRKLSAAKSKPAPKPKTAAKQSASKARPSKQRVGGLTSAQQQQKANPYPLLDPGVVNAALQAGIPAENLEQMQKLMGRGAKTTRVKDMNAKIQPTDHLSEDDGPEVVEDVGEESGLGAADPYAASLAKLTSIVDLLTAEKQKKALTSRLETALDTGAGSSSDHPLQGTGKKAAAARRALRSAYEEHPEEIYLLIEKLMNEDLNTVTLGPGLESPKLCARAWVEFRSKIGGYKTGAFAAWSVAGILDSLMQGHVRKARARAAVCLMMLDQASIDRGNWALAGELSLEAPPPFSSLLAHQPPAVQDGESPFSKLLDPRWSELALAHLKEQDEYLLKRKNVGKFLKGAKEGGAEDGADGETRRKPKPKATPKSQSAGSQQEP
eukprot:s1247_g16.t1